jgi:peroxiredoxin
VIWAIGPDDELAQLSAYSEQLGLTYPVLYDPEGLEAHVQYRIDSTTTNSVFPQDWIIGVDGTVRYVSTAYEPSHMIAVLEEELAKIP